MIPPDDSSRREPALHVHGPHPVEVPSGRRNEALALALDATLTSIWDYNVRDNRVTLDRNWSKMRGGPPIETNATIGSVLDLVHPEDRPRAYRASRECIVGRADEYSQEYRVRDLRGRWLWVQTRGLVTSRDARGRATRLIGTNLDISQRKHSELAVTREAEFLRALNETALALMQHRSMVEILEALSARSARLMDSAVVEIALVENDRLVTKASAGLAFSPVDAQSTRQEAMLSWRAVDTQEPVIVERYTGHPEANPIFHDSDYGPVAVFPILHGPVCLGVIAFSRLGPARPFTEDERNKGLLVAQLSALTIHNAAIYQHAVQIAEARTTALRESERLYRALVESVTHAHYIADRRSIFTYCNPAMYAMGGFDSGELLNQSSFRLVAEEDRPRVMATYKRWIADPQVAHADCEFRVVAKHGRIFWVQQTTNFVRDAAGHVIEGRNVLQDITDRKAAEATLRESEERFRQLVENINQGFYTADSRSLFTYCNPAISLVSGWEPEELRGTSSFRLVADEDRGRVIALYREWSAGTTGGGTVEFRHRTKAGLTIWVEQITEIVRHPDGRVNEFRCFLSNITARKQAESALRESEERFRGVFDHSPIPIALLSIPEGRIVEINQAGITAFGLPREQIVGHTSPELALWVDETERTHYLQLLTTHKSVRGYEARMRRRDGQVVTVLYNGTLVSINGRPYSLNSLQDITDRKAAEAARDRSLALNQATLESTADGILVVDHAGRIENYNQVFIRMWRVPPEVIASRDDARTLQTVLGQLVDPAAFLAKVQLLYRQPELESSDTLAFKDGRVFERYSRPLLIAGQPAGRVWSFRDVTAARQADAALRESEAQFRAVYDESPIPVILLAAAGGQIREVNKAAIETFGFTREESIGRTTLELGVWPNPADREQLVRRLQAEGGVRGFETVMHGKGGRALHVIYNASRITIGGQPYLLNSVIDITDRKRAEQLFHDLFAFSPDAYIIAAADGKVMDVNERMLALFGYDRADVVGRAWSQLVPEEARPRLAARLADYFANPVPHAMGTSAPGLVARAKDGRIFPIDISLSPLKSGGEVRIVAAIRDTTAQLAAEAALRKSEAQFRQAQKMESLGTLAGGIAHDFNNILTGILGYAELALADVPRGHPSREWLEGILKSGGRARSLVHQILTFSRKTESTRVPVRVQQVAAESADLLRSTLPAMVRLERHFDAACPPVFADPTELHQIILNLCTNAWHALPETGGLIDLTVAPREVPADYAAAHPPLRPGPHVLLAIRDNGAGMPADILERIFEPFFTTKEVGKGTGLGLAVVHSVVHAYAGTITVQSNPGQGTQFDILLPALPPVAETRAVAAPSAPRGHGQSLLVVDDEETSGTVVARLVERLGYRATYCADPQRAVTLVEAGGFDLLLTDLAMPGLPGDELARRCLAHRPGLPVVLLSGFIEPEKFQRLRALGIREILGKPPTSSELGEALQRALRT